MSQIKIIAKDKSLAGRSIIAIGGKLTFDENCVCELESDRAETIKQFYGNDFEFPSDKKADKSTKDKTDKAATGEGGGTGETGQQEPATGQKEQKTLTPEQAIATIEAIEKIADLKATAKAAGYPEEEYISMKSKQQVKAYLIAKLTPVAE